MTTTKTKSIKQVALENVAMDKVDTAIETLGTAWRRAIKRGVLLGKYDRNREDLTQEEILFVHSFFQDEAETPPPSVARENETPNFDVALQKAMDKETAKLQQRFEQFTEAESERIGNEWQVLFEKQLSDAKIKIALEQQIKAGEKNAAWQQAQTDKLLKLETEKAAIQTKLVEERFERDSKHNDQLNAQATQFRAANAAKDAAHRAAIEAVQTENDVLKSEIEILKTPDDWWRVSEYDIVNITSNGFAAFSLVNMLQGYGILAAIILILTFRGIIKALKKQTSDWAVWFGMIGIVVIEFIYGSLHSTLFKGILEGKKHLPFDMPYEWVANALAIIISGASIYVAIMTRAQTADDAETERIAEIDNRIAQQSKRTIQ